MTPEFHERTKHFDMIKAYFESSRDVLSDISEELNMHSDPYSDQPRKDKNEYDPNILIALRVGLCVFWLLLISIFKYSTNDLNYSTLSPFIGMSVFGIVVCVGVAKIERQNLFPDTKKQLLHLMIFMLTSTVGSFIILFFIRDMSLTAFTVIFSLTCPLLTYLAPKVLKERRVKYIAIVLILYFFGILFYMGTIQFSDIIKRPGQNPIDNDNGIFDPHYYNSTCLILPFQSENNVPESAEGSDQLNEQTEVTYRGFCFSYTR